MSNPDVIYITEDVLKSLGSAVFGHDRITRMTFETESGKNVELYAVGFTKLMPEDWTGEIWKWKKTDFVAFPIKP